MHVDYDGDAVVGAFDWFPVGALKVEAAFGFEGEVGAGEAASAEYEGWWAECFFLLVYVVVVEDECVFDRVLYGVNGVENVQNVLEESFVSLFLNKSLLKLHSTQPNLPYNPPSAAE